MRQNSESARRLDCALALGVLSLLVASAWLAIRLLAPPSPLPADAPLQEFSACRAIKHDEVIAKEPHPAGSRANEAVQAYILKTLLSMGVEAQALSSLYAEGRDAGQRNMVLGKIPGENHSRAFALMAHYDSVPYGPGAADDGAAVSALLEIARALKAAPPLKNDIIFVFTDAEEGGKLGALAFAEHPWFEDTALMLNLEARGTRGNALIFGTSPENGWLVEQMSQALRYPVATSLMYDIYKRMPFSSDFDTLRARGMKGYDSAFIDNFAWYHTKNDTPEHLDLRSLQQHGCNGLDLARHFGMISLARDVTAPDAMYFNTLGYRLARYPLSWGWPLAIAAVLLAGCAVSVGFFCGHFRLWELLGGLVFWPVAAMLAAGICVVLVGAVWGWDTAWILYTKGITRIPDLLPLHHSNLFVASFAAVGMALPGLLFGGLWGRRSTAALTAGAYAWWSAVLLPLAWFLPGGGYLMMWPLAIHACGMVLYFCFANPGPTSPGWGLVLTLFSLPALVLIAPAYKSFGHSLMIMGAPGLTALVVLGMGLMAPALERIARLNRWCFPILCGTAAAGLYLFGFMHSGHSADNPKLDSLSYGIDYHTNRAYWLSGDAKPSEWTGKFFPADTPRASCQEFVPGHEAAVLKADAPVAGDFPGPSLEVKSDQLEGNERHLVLSVSSPAGPPRMTLRMRSDIPVLESEVFGMPLEKNQKHWKLNFNLFPREGAEITLRLPVDSESIDINVVETHYGLPQLPGMTPRPPHIACQPNTVNHRGRSMPNNRTFVTRSFTLLPPNPEYP